MFDLPESVLSKLDEWRRERARVVFTNGCFDLIHPGHVDILKRARRLGGALVVGLNSDDSVRRLKGEGRPYVPEKYRREMLEELRCVDLVVVFEEDTPLELVGAVRPDVLVKGADYDESEVVGRELVESWGGRVEILDLLNGFSTTEIIGQQKGLGEV